MALPDSWNANRDGSGQMRIAEVFSVLPVSVLVPDRMSSYELVS